MSGGQDQEGMENIFGFPPGRVIISEARGDVEVRLEDLEVILQRNPEEVRRTMEELARAQQRQAPNPNLDEGSMSLNYQSGNSDTIFPSSASNGMEVSSSEVEVPPNPSFEASPGDFAPRDFLQPPASGSAGAGSSGRSMEVESDSFHGSHHLSFELPRVGNDSSCSSRPGTNSDQMLMDDDLNGTMVDPGSSTTG